MDTYLTWSDVGSGWRYDVSYFRAGEKVLDIVGRICDLHCWKFSLGVGTKVSRIVEINSDIWSPECWYLFAYGIMVGRTDKLETMDWYSPWDYVDHICGNEIIASLV